MEKIISLQSFLVAKFKLDINTPNNLEMRNLGEGEDFFLYPLDIEKTKLSEVLDKYFKMIKGSYKLIGDSGHALDIFYIIKKVEIGTCTTTIIPEEKGIICSIINISLSTKIKKH